MKGIYARLTKAASCYGDDLGRGKSPIAKHRMKRKLKARANRRLTKMLND